jgi:predicted RNase H-like nuclease (RuvC/YqgF family)
VQRTFNSFFVDTGTKITEQLVDYIIENNKQVFDAETLRYLYVLQDRVLTEKKNEKMREQMEIARREEAKQILKDLLQSYEEKIARLEQNIRNLNDEIRKLENKRTTLHEKLKDFVEFVRSKELMNDFIEFIKEKRAEEEISQIKEEYELEEDC